MVFQNAQWIWLRKSVVERNEYADFSAVFTIKTVGNVALRISSKSEYVVYVNGKFVGFQQYGDFPDEKVYDEYDLSSVAMQGENVLSVIALSKNYDTSSHIANGKGVIFEIEGENGVALASGEDCLSRLSRGYRSGEQDWISPQLGMTYFYDCTADESWISTSQIAGKNGFEKSVIADEKTNFLKRPVPRLQLKEKMLFSKIGRGLYDAGKECVGQLCFDVESDCEREFSVHFGEHILDGGVRRNIGSRRFSVHFRLKKGRNVFVGWFLRLGLRYLQISDPFVTVREIGIIPAVYPLDKREYTGKAVSKEIYDTAAYTLECCMHDHYEDCPWREQAQYTMDSRTQILCGYYAFGDTRMPSAALRTMAHELTKKNTLRISSPTARELSIPSFSLVFPLMLREYYEFTGDKSLLADVYENTYRMICHYLSARIDGLLPILDEWNFFEWSEGLDNDEDHANPCVNSECFPLGTNAYLVVALENFAVVCEILGKDGSKYRQFAEETRNRAHEAFYCPENGLFYSYRRKGQGEGFAEYGQVFALYAKIAKPQEEQTLLEVLTSENTLTPLTLASYVYKYEVLLQKGGYERYICEEVQRIWGYMLEQGATTFWETIKGADDFLGAGSLCHGWSAVPIYVAHKLEK